MVLAHGSVVSSGARERLRRRRKKDVDAGFRGGEDFPVMVVSPRLYSTRKDGPTDAFVRATRYAAPAWSRFFMAG